ncbi:MAG: prepilin-type N-terminal cleavage/methylation domain-containing protein [Desulfobacteraceae bacterium]
MKRFRQTIMKPIGKSDGFTLLEAVISMMVLSVGILGMIALQTTSVKSNTLAEDVQINTVTAMDQIEELMATDFLDQRFNADGIRTCGPSPNGRFTICITPRDNAFIPGAKRVTVTSRFIPTGGLRQEITLDIFKPRIN